jgi:hypothetical protein
MVQNLFLLFCFLMSLLSSSGWKHGILRLLVISKVDYAGTFGGFMPNPRFTF